MAITPPQQRSLIIAPRISGVLSMAGSSFIVNSTLRRVFRGRANTFDRLMLGMSSLDIFASCAMAFATLPIPKGSPNAPGAQGNVATCNVQGFFKHFAYGVAVYSAQLSIYYVLICRFKWSDEKMVSVEKFLHILPLLVALGGATVALFMEQFNNTFLWCWIAPLPHGCKDSIRHGNEATCIRGNNHWLYRFVLGSCWAWAAMIVACGCMVAVYCTVLQQKKKVDDYQYDGVSCRTWSKRVAKQSLWYLLALFTTWVPEVVVNLQEVMPTNGPVGYPYVLSLAIFLPLQGFLNFLVYFRSNYLKYKRKMRQPSPSSWSSSLSVSWEATKAALRR